jgi:carotenoid cleavage dioxygenase
VRTELTLDGLPVEGILPPEVRGAFFRAVPDPAFPPSLPTITRCRAMA